jgi:DNA-binding NarL/FixJ family response regulator
MNFSVHNKNEGSNIPLSIFLSNFHIDINAKECLNIAILDEDKLSCMGIKCLLESTYGEKTVVKSFFSLTALNASSDQRWDVIIIDANGIDFSMLDVFIWLDKFNSIHSRYPKILFTHRFNRRTLPLNILYFYFGNIYNKDDDVSLLINMLTDMIYVEDNKSKTIPTISESEKNILMEISKFKCIKKISTKSGKNIKKLSNYKNKALTKLGVGSSSHFFASFNRRQLKRLVNLSCFSHNFRE